MFKFSRTQTPVVAVAGNAPGPVRFAADELCRYLALILGVPAVSQSDGPAPRIELSVADDRDLAEEAYDLISENTMFRLVGGGPAGVVYGAYEFLRRYCGCQFSGLGPEGEHVPCLEQVEIPAGRVRRTPKLWYRGLQAHGRTDSNPELDIQRFDWMAKNGMNYVMITPVPDVPAFKGETTFDPQTGRVINPVPAGRYTNRWFRENWLPEIRKRGLKVDMNHHNLFFWLPPDVYFKDHPEWYAMVNGERVRKAHQLCICTSNDEAVETLIANVKAYLRENPEVKIVGVIPEDGSGYCMCDACRQQDESPEDVFRIGGRMRVRDSEAENPSIIRRYVRLVNRVACAVREEFPDVKIGSAHYSSLVFAPRGVKLESNVVPWIAMYWRCGAHTLTDTNCLVNDSYLYELRKWVDLHGGKIILYEYYMGMSAQVAAPYPMDDLICKEWPELKKMGIDGATVQSMTANHNTYALNYLAFARSGWDDAVDCGRLREDFLLGMYGSCAAAVRPIYDQLEKGRKHARAPYRSLEVLTGLPENKTGCVFPDARLSVPDLVGKPGFQPIFSCIERALAAATSERETLQLRRLRDAARYWQTLYDVAPMLKEIEDAEIRIGCLAAKAWMRLEEGLGDIDALQRSGWMNVDGRDGRWWLKMVRPKSSMRAFVESDRIIFQALAGGPATVVVTRDGIREEPENLSVGQIFNAWARERMRIEIDNTPSVALSINGNVLNGERLVCHKKRVTIDVEWREDPNRKGRKKVFCTFS